MVGVPGKSKGCHTCRRRRIKCDEGKPDCQKCLRGGRQCEGYDRRPVFLNRNAGGLVKRRHLEEATLRSENIFSTGASSAATSATNAIDSDSGEEINCLRVDGQVQRSAYELLPPPSPPNKHALINGLAGQFHQRYVPYLWRNRTDVASAGNWMVSILSMTRRGPALENALCALIAIQAGKDQRNPDLQRYARLMYTRGLFFLQETILDDGSSVSDETLAAVSCLQNYELQEATSGTPEGFNAHTRGLEQLVLRRKRKEWSTNLGQQILFEAVFSSMILALQYRKSSPLQGCEFSAAQWGNPMDVHLSLLEIGFHLAKAIADLSKLVQLPPGPVATDLARELYKTLLDIRSNLEGWHTRLIENVRLTFDWPDPTFALWQRARPDAFATGIRVDALQQPLLMVDYWVLYCMQWRISSLLKSLVPADDRTHHLDAEDCDVLQYVHNIVQTAPLFLAEENGMYCARRIIMPLRFALEISRYVEGDRARELEHKLNGMMDITHTGRGLRHASVVRRRSGGWEYMEAELQKHMPSYRISDTL